MKSIDYWLDKLELEPHPEGGYFKEIYRSEDIIKKSALKDRFGGDRVYYTSIYFLITSDNHSKFHKVMADELWHFLYGSPIKMHFIDKHGRDYIVNLGIDLENGEQPTFAVPHETWMAAEVTEKDSYALVGCTTAPGFEFDDFVMADKKDLIKKYPELKDIINKFT